MRALPAFSLAYLDDTAVGNTAADGAAAVVASGLVGAVSFAGSFVIAGSVVDAGLVAGSVVAAGAFAAHSVLRKSFHVLPASVPADFAAWYFTLHSFDVSAPAGEVIKTASTLTRTAIAASSHVSFATTACANVLKTVATTDQKAREEI